MEQNMSQTTVTNPIKHSGFGTASLILAIIRLIMSSIIFLYFIGIILGILALVFVL